MQAAQVWANNRGTQFRRVLMESAPEAVNFMEESGYEVAPVFRA